MRFYYSRLIATLLTCSLALSLIPNLAKAQCFGFQDSSTASPQGSCGNNLWALAVTYNQGVRSEFGSYWAYGQCTGGYHNCSNNLVPNSFINAEEHFFDEGPTGYEEEEVRWTLDSWTVEYQSCNNGNPSDVEEFDINNPNEDTEIVECV